MSSTAQSTSPPDLTGTAKTAATHAVESGVYAATRAKQEGQALQAQAEHQTSQTREALNSLEENLAAKTDAAVEEGKQDVQQVTEAGETYLQKALHVVDAGLTATQGYLTAGKERLNAPAVGGEPPATTGITAQLTATATAVLDVANQGIGYAQHTLHERGPAFPHATESGPTHPVTVPAKPVSQALSENAAAVQSTIQAGVSNATAAAQPHVDAAKEAAQPYVDSAASSVKPKVDAAAAGLQSQVDALQGAMASDKPVMQQVQEAGQAAVNTAKPYVAAAGDATASTMQAAGQKINDVTATNTKDDPTYTV